jgi:pilus assembly protein CpaC
MVSYSGAKTMKSYIRKVVLLSFAIIMGATYNAFAQENKNADAAAGTAAGTAASTSPTPAGTKPAATAPAATAAKAPAAPATPASPAVMTPVGTAAKNGAPEAPEKVIHAAKRILTLEQHTAEVVPIDKNVTEVFVSNPDVADVTVNSPGVAYVYGKKPGLTTIFAGSKKGSTYLNMDVQVTFNVNPLKKAIHGAYPQENINILSTPSGLILEGQVSSPKVSKDIVNMAQRYVGEKDQIVNNLGITTPTQVYLQVKVAEVNRTVLHQLNINWQARAAVGSVTFGLLTGRQVFDPTSLITPINNPFLRDPTSTGLNSIGTRAVQRGPNPSWDVTNVLDALNREGLTTVLAEPNLVALSGETAKVLVGGEFPFPVPQGNNAVTIQFKQFGIMLDFTPTILSGNQINLHVRPEVSALDKANGISVNLGGATNETIPALTTRRAETSVEMASGQSLAIAGLFTNTMSNTLTELPGLGAIPVLGALFRSSGFQRNETELVIIVTPYLVTPVKNHSLMTAADNLRLATHLGMILSGRMNRPGPKTPGGFHTPTNDIAATADGATMSAASFETSLVSGGAVGESGIPTNDQKLANDYAINKPEDLTSGSGMNFAGEAGFYHE